MIKMDPPANNTRYKCGSGKQVGANASNMCESPKGIVANKKQQLLSLGCKTMPQLSDIYQNGSKVSNFRIQRKEAIHESDFDVGDTDEAYEYKIDGTNNESAVEVNKEDSEQEVFVEVKKGKEKNHKTCKCKGFKI